MHPEPAAPQPVSDVAPAVPRPHLLRQDWRDVGFLHWEADPGLVARHLPPGVRPDLFEGRAHVGLVPFRMVGTGPARGPAVPWFGTFAETNVRLYSVDDHGRRGVVFCSLDAARALPVLVGRAGFGLPYLWSRTVHRADRAAAGGELVHTYTTSRRRSPVTSTLTLRPGSAPARGALESFLSARWGLHVAHGGRTWFVPNRHEPWPLRTAEVLELRDGLVPAAGFAAAAGRAPDHVMFAAGVSTVFGRPVRVR